MVAPKSRKITQKRHQKGGRPTKLDYESVQKLISIFSIDGTIEEACSQAEISVSTFHDRYSKDLGFLDENGKEKSFKKAIDKAREYPFILAKKTLLKGASSDPKTAIEFLKRRHKDYKDKSESVVASFSFTGIEIGDVAQEDTEA